ncbi:DUF4116 domain-containing protein [Legionella lansingensis]|nr:DUF4116 domain-containing protein [Legionella lansingensis]
MSTSEVYIKLLNEIKLGEIRLEEVDSAYRDRQMCLEAVKQDGLSLEDVPADLKQDKEICLEAVKQNGLALDYVPQNLRDREICLAAIKQAKLASLYVPDDLKKQDREFCLELVKIDGLALKDASLEIQNDEEVCLAALEQNYKAFKWVGEKLQEKILQEDSNLAQLIKSLYIPSFYLNLHENKESLPYIEDIYKKALHTCTTIILQPDQKDDELEDIQQVYASKQGLINTILVRNRAELATLLKDLALLDNKAINFALIDHTHLGDKKIADISPNDIASLANQYPIIKKITLLSCRSAGGDESLLAEEQNATDFANLKTILEEEVKKTYPSIFGGEKEQATKKRLKALVNDLLWQNGERLCGIRVMLKSDENIISSLMESGLDQSLDAAYVLVRKKETDDIAVYYLERNIEKVNCVLISDKLQDEQLKQLREISTLTTWVDGNRKNKKHLLSASKSIEGWCLNKRGKITLLNESSILDLLTTILNHKRDSHYSSLPPLAGQKRSFKRSVEMSAEDKDFEKIAKSLTGQVVQAIQKQSKGKKPFVELVKGYREFLFPDQKGLITIGHPRPFINESYTQSFFGKSNIKPSIKIHLIKSTEKGTVKSVKVKP